MAGIAAALSAREADVRKPAACRARLVDVTRRPALAVRLFAHVRAVPDASLSPRTARVVLAVRAGEGLHLHAAWRARNPFDAYERRGQPVERGAVGIGLARKVERTLAET